MGSEFRRMNSGPESQASTVPPSPTNVDGQPLAREALDETQTEPAVAPVEATEAAERPPESPEPETAESEEESPSDEREEREGWAEVQRFLGGETTATAFKPRWPRWFQIFLITTFLAINFFALCALLLYPVAGDTARPTVRCLVAERYSSAAMPPFEFADNDAARVLGITEASEVCDSPGFFPARDVNDIQSFFETQFQTAESDTCVVYVAVHGFGDSDGARLLPADATGVDTRDGCDVSHMLNAIAETRTQNIVVMLDCGRFREGLRMGCERNEFHTELARAFDDRMREWQKDPRFEGRSVLLLTSASGPEVSHV